MYKIKLYNEYDMQEHADITNKYTFKSVKQAVWWLYNRACYLGITIIHEYDIVRI